MTWHRVITMALAIALIDISCVPVQPKIANNRLEAATYGAVQPSHGRYQKWRKQQ